MVNSTSARRDYRKDNDDENDNRDHPEHAGHLQSGSVLSVALNTFLNWKREPNEADWEKANRENAVPDRVGLDVVRRQARRANGSLEC